jgi:hypothetical protein
MSQEPTLESEVALAHKIYNTNQEMIKEISKRKAAIAEHYNSLQRRNALYEIAVRYNSETEVDLQTQYLKIEMLKIQIKGKELELNEYKKTNVVNGFLGFFLNQSEYFLDFGLNAVANLK